MTSRAIKPLTSNELAEGTMFSERQVDLIKQQIMPGASSDDLMLFIQVSSHRGLDPFMKHIYAVKRREKVNNEWVDKWTYQVSIDGLRLIAQRSGRYRGQTEPQWCGQDGKWVDVWLADVPPAAARIGVWIEGNPQPLMAVALYRTYVQRARPKKEGEIGEPTKFWQDMPELMLSKCAEALALRKAFPEEAGGLYTSDEMAQSASDRPMVDEDGVIEGSTRVVESAPSSPRKRLDPRDKAKLDLWRLANGTLGLDKEQLETVGHKLTGASLEDADAEMLQFVHDKLLAMDEQELEELVNGTPEQVA